jgi:hypothetical protein
MMVIQCSAWNINDNGFFHLKKFRPIVLDKNRFILHCISMLYFYSNRWMKKTPSWEANVRLGSQDNSEPEG